MNTLNVVLLIIALSTLQVAAPAAIAVDAPRPNFLLILADDLGYSDIGAFGGEIDTPNLDHLSNEGLQLTNFYVTPTCSPTRAMLMTGLDNHLVGLGAMATFGSKGLKQQPGYQGYLTNRAPTIAEILSDHGYRTYMAGKWHLGYTAEQTPDARGFHHSYGLLNGGGNHFNLMGYSAKRAQSLFRKNGERVSELPQNFYSSINYTDEIIANLRAANSSEKPFFAYLAYTAPHSPLQAPASAIAKYKGIYDAGYQHTYRERLRRQKDLGIVSEQFHETDSLELLTKWESMSQQEQLRETRTMEIYAAMIDVMDQQIGRVINYLKDSGEYENTVIIFLSDNGPEFQYSLANPENLAWIANTFNNSLGNMGNADSFIYRGPQWARVSATPFSGFKESTWEGGIRSPAIISYPRAQNLEGRMHEVATVRDIMPTLLSLAGIDKQALSTENTAYSPTGHSLVHSALQSSDAASLKRGFGWELHGNRAFRRGDWKIVWAEKDHIRFHEPSQWRLFNVRQDIAELDDQAVKEPQILSRMIEYWHQYASDVGVQLDENW